jgi:hypothetical protein
MKRYVIKSILILSYVCGALTASIGATRRDPTDRPSALARNQAQDKTIRALTVADSIEMTHIVDPYETSKEAHPQFSSDGKNFLVVTEKGLLKSNLREFSLLVYSAKRPAQPPKRMATFKSSSNRSGISGAKWFTNESISLVGENPGELPQIYLINCRTRKVQQLTSAVRGVEGGYDISRDLTKVIYSTPWEGYPAKYTRDEQHGFTVSSESLSDLNSGQWKRPRWIYQAQILNISTKKVRTVDGGPFLSIPARLNFSISPDGKFAVAEQPALAISPTWESYEDHTISQFARSMGSVKKEGRLRGSLAQAMLVDTETGHIQPLVDAPLAGLISNAVLWSADSHSVIVGRTYLPLDGTQPEEALRRKGLPVVAEFSLPNRSFRRIADIPNSQIWSLKSASQPDVFAVHAEQPEDGDIYKPLPKFCYARLGEEWIKKNCSDETPEFQNITIQQTINSWPKLVAIDPTTNQERVILDPNPQFAQRRFGHAETIHWKGSLGESWIGGLVYPTEYSTGNKYPLVIQTHGFDPDTFLLDGLHTTAMAAQELANKGIMVLQIGESPLYEDAQTHPAGQREGAVQMSGVESAVDYLDQLGLIDKNRLGLVGFSRTKYHVEYALTHSHYQFAAATVAEGIDFGYWSYLLMGNLSTYYQVANGGLPWPDNWKGWMEHSVTFNVDKIHTPVRVEADSNPGAILYNWEIFEMLRLLRKPVEMIFVPDGAHPVVKPWERMTSQQGNVDWMTFWLKGEEDSDPAKADQYERWREMRKSSSARSAADRHTTPSAF